MKLIAPALLSILITATGCGGNHEGPGTVATSRLPAAIVAARSERQVAPRRAAASEKQILFGDLHVHSTFSMDAFALSLPIRGGEGAHPPADACDFARYCAGLDFFSINDHAESLTPRHWRETKQSIRACNAAAGDPDNPDVVAFLGWEWTQVGTTPDDHFGHKNVILLETADDRVPARAISAIRPEFTRMQIPTVGKLLMPLIDFPNRQRSYDFFRLLDEIAAVPACPSGVDTLELPADCMEAATTPADLFRRLDRWDTPHLVVPHGTTWGLNTPPLSAIDDQLDGDHDAASQTLIEIYSGHGNAEEYRPWRANGGGDSGLCSPPSADFEPCCWRAGEIIRSRCDDPQSPECAERVEAARRHFVEAGVAGYRTIVDTDVTDWLDCGQCRDCFLPAFDYRPAMSAQYALAAAKPGGVDQRFRFGFIGSSDTHSARAGKGYKELDRLRMIDAGLGATFGNQWGNRELRARDRSHSVRLADLPLQQRRYGERGVSYIVGGGLVAVHADGRDRRSIWSAIERKEVYATSGPRILLWFDALSATGEPSPMGSTIPATRATRFRVRAAGAFRQTPGCPAGIVGAIGEERLERLCGQECHHPGETRQPIDRIEIIRIRPRVGEEEAIETLIDDPWRTFDCPREANGCAFEFEDAALADNDREHIYYARVLQEATPAINGGGLRCSGITDGTCDAVDPCYSDERTAADDDCLAPVRERAWSSPIFVVPGA